MAKILLYAHDPKVGKIYLDLIRLSNIDCVLIDSFETFYAEGGGESYCGILVDIVSSIRASQFDREVLKSLMDVYPSMRLRWDPAGGDIRTLMTGAGTGQKVSLNQFITAYCRLFSARPIRFSPRKGIHCNVLCSIFGEMPEDSTVRTVTSDISTGGCFLYSTSCLAPGTILWIRFIDLVDNTPVQVEVIWCREWGRTMNLPGVGVKFISIKDEQRQEFSTLGEYDSPDI